MQIDQQQLLERFLRYVAVDTSANPETNEYPSSAGQWTLGKMLAEELRDLGFEDAHQDDHGLVWATLPSNVDRPTPTFALNAHLDTSPEAPGKDVKPNVIASYRGGDIPLQGDTSQVIRVADCPALTDLVGKTLVTTDGTTLLGGDDKAGVAAIMQAVATFVTHPELPHGKVRILFTCDEEIGRGVNHVDLSILNADACYTLDGSGAGVIDTETFSADLATVVIRGVNIHPAIAKDKMVNALRAAGLFIAGLPRDLAPEKTDERAGFLHPYWLQGQVDRVELRVLIRDFDTHMLAARAELLHRLAASVQDQIAGCACEVNVTPQYRNLGDGLAKRPEVVERAVRAHQRLGRTARLDSVRGGTDGSRLTEMGLPTPNLSTGQHNLHSRLEFVCLDEMVQAVELIVELGKVWSEADASSSRGQ